MPSYTIYANTDDHTLAGTSSASWASARAGTGTNNAFNQSVTTLSVGSYYDPLPEYAILQMPMHFDTSAVSGTETSTTLTVVSTNQVGEIYEAMVQSWTGLSGANYVPGASLVADFGPRTVNAAAAWTFTKTNPAISISSAYGIYLYPQRARTNVAPTNYRLTSFRSADTSGTTNDPYLSITTVTSVSLTVDNASHAHAATSPTLAAKSTLSSNGATHAHAATSPALSFIPGVAPDNATHAHTAQLPTIAWHGSLAPDSASHGHSATSPSLASRSLLAVNDNAHAHICTSPQIVFSGWFPATPDGPVWSEADPGDPTWTVQTPAASAWA